VSRADGPGWVGAALGAAAAFLIGVLLVVALGGGRHTVTRTKTVTVPATITGGGTVIVSTRVPALVGQRLDIAKTRLKRARFDVAVRGGGILGILRDHNWVVVSQDPAAGTLLEVGSTVHVDVSRP
jgi:PASTA domain